MGYRLLLIFLLQVVCCLGNIHQQNIVQNNINEIVDRSENYITKQDYKDASNEITYGKFSIFFKSVKINVFQNLWEQKK